MPFDSIVAIAPTVLVIDDDPRVRETLEIMLDTYGFQVVMASNGRQGIAAFRDAAPDVVITDILMPEQDGIETIRAIRSEFPDAKIIAMSGRGDFAGPDYLTIACKLGADRSILKPFDGEELENTLRSVLSMHSDKLATIAIGTASLHRTLDGIEERLDRLEIGLRARAFNAVSSPRDLVA